MFLTRLNLLSHLLRSLFTISKPFNVIGGNCKNVKKLAEREQKTSYCAPAQLYIKGTPSENIWVDEFSGTFLFLWTKFHPRIADKYLCEKYWLISRIYVMVLNRDICTFLFDSIRVLFVNYGRCWFILLTPGRLLQVRPLVRPLPPERRTVERDREDGGHSGWCWSKVHLYE
jgi:hypothetical protein